MSRAERHQVLVEWNDTDAEYPRHLCAHQLFEAQAEKTPDLPALVFEGETLSYRELNESANRFAHHLRRRGAGPETLVAIYAERSFEMISGLLGVLKAGAAYLPLDPSYPEELTAFMLEDARVPLLLTQERLLPRLSHPRSRTICLDTEWNQIARENGTNPENLATPDNLAYLIYTSGSTGKPKGVMVGHRNLVSSTTARHSFYREIRGGFLLLSSLAFDSSVAGIFGTLCRGGELWLPAEEAQKDPALLAKIIRGHVIGEFLAVPSLHARLLEEARHGRLGSLARVVVAGETCPPNLVREHRRLLPGTDLFNEYGPTETTVWSAVYECRTDPAGERVPIGRPIANTRIYILDAPGNPVPLGDPGELYIGGEGVARGYWNRPALTEEKFLRDPFREDPEARVYRTGDLARYLPDGSIDFLGRLDQQVKVRGFRIEPGEVERALARHPAVRESVVIGREDVPGDMRLAAYLTLSGPEPSLEELRAFLKEKLPDHMIPSAFVFLDSLPRTPGGKVDRKALPAPGRPHLQTDFRPPRTPLEKSLAAIWRDLLGLERVGRDEDFFLLGGHSLSASRVLSRVRQRFQVEIPLRALFDSPTVAGLADRIRVARPEERPPDIPLKKDARKSDLPPSFAQQRLWFLDQLGQQGNAYNLPEAVLLKGPLDAVALERSIAEILRRHESLRTSFPNLEGVPFQRVSPAHENPLQIEDLTALPVDVRRPEAERLAREEASRPFDLARPPLFRARLFRLVEQDHLLLLIAHHIVADGWSIGVLARELSILYEAFAAGRHSPLPELPFQYSDFSDWQRQWIEGDVLKSQLSYWKHQLASPLPLLTLPTDRPRPAIQSVRGGRRRFLLPAPLAKVLRELSRRQGATLFMTLLAGCQTLLLRYSGQEDISVGSPIAGRTRVETEEMIGFFVNTLVLRTDLSGDPTFRELLARVREVCLEAYAHQDLPFEKLVLELQPERSVSHSPLFQVMFTLENAPEQPWELAGLEANPFPMDTGTAKFDLTLTLIEGPEELAGVLEYNADLFDAETVARMIGHFQTLLEGAVSDPDRRLSELPLLTLAERRQLLFEWNDTDADYPRELCAHQLFEAQVQKTPDSPALVFEGDTLSYRQLNEHANQLAHYLRRRGAGPESLVAIYAERSFEMVAAILAVLKAGAAYVPLDPSYPEEMTAFMLEDAQASLLLTQQRLLPRLPHPRAGTICLDTEWNQIARENATNPENLATPDNLAYLIYTSGSTGKPKGAMIPHRGLVNYLAWCVAVYPLEDGSGSPVHSSIAFDLTITSLFAPLLTGRPVFLLPDDYGIEGLAEALEAGNDFSLIKLTPTHLDALGVLVAEEGGVPGCAAFVVGGEALRGEHLLFWRAQAPAVRIFNEYGPTETVVGCVVHEVPEGTPAPGPVPIGRPIANTRIYILDARGGPVPIGVSGELYIGGDGVARGYWNRQELTAEKYIPDPFREESDARLYRTGDLGRYLSDGSIEFQGRLDQQVKVRGFRVEPGEIETALNRHPSVRESAVLARDSAPGDRSLVAYLSVAGPAPSAEELRVFLKMKLPAHMIPSTFNFIESLPKTSGGKVDRNALPAPGVRDPKREEAVPPRDDIERELARIWESVLGAEGIGIRDDFFDLGGHSLLAVRLFSRIEKAFGKRLPLATLFGAGTIEELAQRLRQEAWSAPWSSLVEIQTGGGRPPFFCVHPIGGNILNYHDLARRLGPDQPVFGLQAVGLDRKQPPLTRVEDMAEHYIREIRDVQPSGAYYLGGVSFGGVVAFEMACRLLERGEKIALLALLDTHCPVYPTTLPGRELHRFKLERLMGKAVFHAKRLLESGAHVREMAKGLRKRMKRRISRLARSVAPDTPSGSRLTVSEANRMALDRYTPGSFPGRVTLFKAAQRSMRTSYDPRDAWEHYARGGFEVREVPGPHATMLIEPHVEALARELRACLDREIGKRERLSRAG